MNTLMLRIAAVTLLALDAIAAGYEPRGYPDPTLCSISLEPFHPAPTSTYFLGLALADTMVAGPDTVSLTGEPGHWGRVRGRRPVSGQLIELRGFGGAGASVLDSGKNQRAPTQVLVVMWDYDAGCRATQWGQSARWAVVGSTLFVEASLRPSTKWVGGHPTFDTFFAGQLAYPSSAVNAYRHLQQQLDTVSGHSPAAIDWLTADQVFDLVKRLPAECDWYQRPQEAAAQLETVKRERASWLTHYPADGIIRVHERRAENPNANRSDPYFVRLCAA